MNALAHSSAEIGGALASQEPQTRARPGQPMLRRLVPSASLAAVAFAALLGPAPGRLQAQERPPTAEEFRALQKRVLALEQQLKAFMQTSSRPPNQSPTPSRSAVGELDSAARPPGDVRLPDAQSAPTGKTAVPEFSFGAGGVLFRTADDEFQFRLRGYIQADARFYLDDSSHQSTDTFLLNRVRPVLEGTIFKQYDFKLMPDFGEGRSLIQDAFADLRFLPWLGIRVGKFKGPIELERLQSARDLTFVQRSMTTGLAPNRDVGAALHGEVLNGVLGYEAGVFNGAPDGGSDDTDENDGKDVAGRVFAHPFKFSGQSALRGLGLGVAGSFGQEDGTAPSYKTVGQQTFFSYASGVTADGERERIAPQLYYYWGPFGLLGEYILSSGELRKGDVAKHLDHSAWQVTASYVLTGEPASYEGVVPAKPFNPALGRWGALELAARGGQWNADGNTFRNFGTAVSPSYFADPTKSAAQATSWGVGLNWYLNRGVKLMLDYDQTVFDGGARQGDRPIEHSLFSRTQISF